MKYVTTINGKEYLIEILDEHRIAINGQVQQVDFVSISGQPIYSLILNGTSHEAFVDETEEGWQVLLRGRQYVMTVEDEREKRLRAAASHAIAESGEFHLKAPMPGLVVSVPVQEGQTVQKGQVLVILESMKMQNELKAPRAGSVVRIRVKPGDTVEQRQTLLSLQS